MKKPGYVYKQSVKGVPVEEKEKTVAPGITETMVLDSLSKSQANLEVLSLVWEHQAKELRLKYDALLKAGFTEAQALALLGKL